MNHLLLLKVARSQRSVASWLRLQRSPHHLPLFFFPKISSDLSARIEIGKKPW
jgi:hypothetical protein